ncbi:chromosome segregation protein SMC [Vagococcus xieshaowenii]|uniref:Chromosome partition protein Smc n=1 Tax=Vagococcus xieshaowenii TaxID=2562451 RepID=A0A4Z0DAJ3_9ENTE|nr:chromosome segregation protein SMC [Vagococcus xieshaowenii]QCA28272.1 chromosome segregation protein SMC [Vagococcus xieshaowenii]TFZ41927.1 chromosome segregation protein SMC [Vagococcus xieshaowenii]
MFLKRIEISGFKSFAERTTIEFNQGLTAVVGPNGSGKSNITDAIRWVLGEQSAKNLRGGKMPDVIFSGTSKRKALNMAEVTLVLDNEHHELPIDFSEVSVTRRLNRSGDSDFFINKQSCRLKDITELFTDSGLGKESFSIISQGKVEAIFNSKPEDRRGVFEEAAGVLKYKQRKTQAENKLFETEDNLNRVQDIIYELESQIEPLFRQSQTAQTYQVLKERLTQMDVAITVQDIETYKLQWEQAKLEMANIDQSVKQLSEQKTEHEAAVQGLRQERENYTFLLDQTQQKLVEVTEQFEKTEGQKNLIFERSQNTEKLATDYQMNIEGLKERERLLLKEIEKISHNIEESIKAKQLQNQKVTETKGLLERFSQTSEEQVEDIRNEYVEVMQEQVNVKNDLKHLERQYELESSRHQNVLGRRERMLSNEQQLAERKEAQNNLLVKHQAMLKELLEEYALVERKYQFSQEQLQTQQVSLQNGKSLLQQAISRQSTLKDLQENYSGFYQGVRAILKQKKQLPGIVGAVAELVKVPTELVTAIDTVLGGNAQSVIVEDEKAGRQAINYLKQRRLGRATFLPITTIKPRTINAMQYDRIVSQPGFVGIASQLVKCDDKIRQVVENLLGTTLIAESLESANNLAKALNYQYRVVSLEGDLMNPGGSMTGGAVQSGKKGSLLAVSGELETLTTQIADMENMLTKHQHRVERLLEETAELKELLAVKRQDGEEARFKEQSLANEVLMVEKEWENLQREKEGFEFETKDVTLFFEEYEDSKANLTKELEHLTAKMTELDTLLKSVTSEATSIEAKRNEYQVLYHEQMSELAILKQKVAHQEETMLERQQSLGDLRRELRGIEERLALLVNREQLDKLDPKQLEQQMLQLANEKETIQAEMSRLKVNRDETQQQLNEEEQAAVQVNESLRQLYETKSEVEVTVSMSGSYLDRSLKYLQEDYQMTYEWAKEHYLFEEEMTQEAREEVKALKLEIEALGPINMEAIMQYEQVKERFDFLTVQRDDLLTAKDSLFQTMNEMDETVKVRFEEIFIGIQAKFRETFPKMFGGGHADLVLTDPDNLLTTGIDIVAQPPGKKLQNLSLLSGGERALTAIALLFSIIQVRPVPFCVLDEVEAALDEANVTRFGQYLSLFEKDTQFIVITHRKGTMESADVLYGVTMQESGVSSIVSVKLEELSNDTALEA